MNFIKKFLQFVLATVFLYPFNTTVSAMQKTPSFDFNPLSGTKPIRLEDYRGQVLLIVNTASQCGFTPQYEGLQSLYEKYRSKGLTVLGIPSNDFGSQEPGTHKQIQNFCQTKYNVSFPMTAKYSVSGKKAHPFFQWMKTELKIPAPKWNFSKYLMNKEGKVIHYFSSFTKPNSSKITKAIELALSEA